MRDQQDRRTGRAPWLDAAELHFGISLVLTISIEKVSTPFSHASEISFVP